MGRHCRDIFGHRPTKVAVVLQLLGPCRILGLAGLHILKQSIFSAPQSAEFLRSGDNIIKINRSHFHRMNQNIHSHKA